MRKEKKDNISNIKLNNFMDNKINNNNFENDYSFECLTDLNEPKEVSEGWQYFKLEIKPFPEPLNALYAFVVSTHKRKNKPFCGAYLVFVVWVFNTLFATFLSLLFFLFSYSHFVINFLFFFL